jgi:hypothetical protein
MAVTGPAAVGWVLRLAVQSRPLDVLEHRLISDDTYYTLSIARLLAYGCRLNTQQLLALAFPTTKTRGSRPFEVGKDRTTMWSGARPARGDEVSV